ncbi:hypothetical protein [Lentzea jiangxiensis]|uniref:hypothetical protein n=1 Tax=Lentzea jiangxiensis TaxID=641025 RepID=UPI00115F89D1|nr:hypothetical protein [Lentzea jiangxiensis]
MLRWGATPLNTITALGVNKWISDLQQLDYANTTVVKVLSMILTDTADEHLILTNPIRRYRRRGRRSYRIGRKRVWATPTEVLRIAEQAAALGGETASLLIITAAWTGCRWGEPTGLRRDNIDLDRGTLTIDPRTGALHESAHTRWLGSPKTPRQRAPSPCHSSSSPCCASTLSSTKRVRVHRRRRNLAVAQHIHPPRTQTSHQRQ